MIIGDARGDLEMALDAPVHAISDREFPLAGSAPVDAPGARREISNVDAVRHALTLVPSAACDALLDPFCGWGTTGVVARLLGVAFFGVERARERARIAAVRSLGSVTLSGRIQYIKAGNSSFPLAEIDDSATSHNPQRVVEIVSPDLVAEIGQLPRPHELSRVLHADSADSRVWEQTELLGPGRVWAYASPSFSDPHVVKTVSAVLNAMVKETNLSELLLEWWEPQPARPAVRSLARQLRDSGWAIRSVWESEHPLREGVPLLLLSATRGTEHVSD